MKKLASGRATLYHYDYAGNLIAETDGNGTPLRDYVYLNGERIAMRVYGTQAGWYYFINDHLGTPQKIVSESGSVVWAAAYLPFGEAQIITEIVENNFRFPGQYYDAETGLHYNWNRYYDPKTGRYLTPDPIGLDGGVNLFVYVGGNPVSRTDPAGLLVRIISDDPLDRAMILSYISQMVGTDVKTDSDGFVSADFESPGKFTEPAMWLKKMINNTKRTVDIKFGDAGVFGAGSFGNGTVTLDYDYLKYQSSKFSYRSGWLGLGYDYFTGPDTLAHELLGHGYDWMFENMPGDPRLMTGSEKLKWERRAVERANKVREALCKKPRYF